MEKLITQKSPWILRTIPVHTWKNRVYPNRSLLLIFGLILSYLFVTVSLLTIFFSWSSIMANRSEGSFLPFFRVYNISGNLLEWDFGGLDIFILLFQVIGFLCLLLFYSINEFTGKTDLNRFLIFFQSLFTIFWIFISLTMVYPPWGPDINFFDSHNWGLWVGIWIRRWSISPLERWLNYIVVPFILGFMLVASFWIVMKGKWLQAQYQSLLYDLEAQEQSILITQLENSALPLQTLMNLFETHKEESLFIHLQTIAIPRLMYPIRIKPNFVTLSKVS